MTAVVGVLVVASFAPAGSTAWSQTAASPVVRTIAVDGRAMRIMTAGLDQRKPGQPVVILETGAGGGPGSSPLDTWQVVLPAIARLAPVLAYERRGHGQSEADTQRPTMRRVAQVLHHLLTEARIPPPYVLVGQSWGGNYIRAFFDQYPTEVVGLVFIDAATGAGPTREEMAAVVPPENRAATLAPPVLPPIPPDTPAGLRAEFEEIGKEMTNDGQESRSLRRVAGVPIGIVVATHPGRMQGVSGAITRLMIQHQMELAMSVQNGILVTANVGHHVQNHEPALVAFLVQYVLNHPPASGK
jgi:pimeloyl-ACP methyl ester carboxylesterase